MTIAPPMASSEFDRFSALSHEDDMSSDTEINTSQQQEEQYSRADYPVHGNDDRGSPSESKEALHVSSKNDQAPPFVENAGTPFIGVSQPDAFAPHVGFAHGYHTSGHASHFKSYPTQGVHAHGVSNGTMGNGGNLQHSSPPWMSSARPADYLLAAPPINVGNTQGYNPQILHAGSPSNGLTDPPHTDEVFPFTHVPDPNVKNPTPSWPTGFFSPYKFPLGWEDHARASSWRTRVTVQPTVDPQCDPTIHIVEANFEHYLRQIILAMFNQIGTHDKKNSAQSNQFNQWALDVVSNPDIEATAHEIFHSLMDRCKNGFRGHGLKDDATKPATGLEVDRTGTCQERVQNVIDALATSKCVCRDVFTEDSKIKLLVNAPMAFRKSKDRNIKNNWQKKQEREELLKLKKCVKTGEAKGAEVVLDQQHNAGPQQVSTYTTLPEAPMAPIYNGQAHGWPQGQLLPRPEMPAAYTSALPIQGFTAHGTAPTRTDMGLVTDSSPDAAELHTNVVGSAGDKEYWGDLPVAKNVGHVRPVNKRAIASSDELAPPRKMARRTAPPNDPGAPKSLSHTGSEDV